MQLRGLKKIKKKEERDRERTIYFEKQICEKKRVKEASVHSICFVFLCHTTMKKKNKKHKQKQKQKKELKK